MVMTIAPYELKIVPLVHDPNFVIKPIAIDKTGPTFDYNVVLSRCFYAILAQTYFTNMVKIVTNDIDKATEITDQATKNFDGALHKFFAVQEKLSDCAKKSSSNVRDASEKLAQGLARVEKAANFDRLERYVELLERAATAMNALAELEASGKLDKIASALK